MATFESLKPCVGSDSHVSSAGRHEYQMNCTIHSKWQHSQMIGMLVKQTRGNLHENPFSVQFQTTWGCTSGNWMSARETVGVRSPWRVITTRSLSDKVTSYTKCVCVCVCVLWGAVRCCACCGPENHCSMPTVLCGSAVAFSVFTVPALYAFCLFGGACVDVRMQTNEKLEV